MLGRSALKCVLAALLATALYGCATAPELVYVKEAQQVTTQALEPVMLQSVELEKDVKRWGAYIPTVSAEDLISVVQTEIANTKRFTKVLLNVSEGDTFEIYPRIERIESQEQPIATDPTRKRIIAKAKVKLDVFLINQRNQKELVKSFYDERSLDERPKKIEITTERKQNLVRRALTVAFRASADQLGHGFNPSYEMGTISKLNGRIAYVQINTSKIRKMPKKQQAVEIIDDNNNVLASMAELQIEDGVLSGRFFEKGGASIKEGMKVRARINAMIQDS